MIEDWRWVFNAEQIEIMTHLITRRHPFPQVLWQLSRSRAGIHDDAVEIDEDLYELTAQGYRIQYRRLIWERIFVVAILQKAES
ncbi:MAG: hypothetical protein R3A44_32755 [Caldilineaceae bacterium]